MIKFFKSVGQEMKLSHWPSAKENRRDTANVVVTSLLYAIFLGALDSSAFSAASAGIVIKMTLNNTSRTAENRL